MTLVHHDCLCICRQPRRWRQNTAASTSQCSAIATLPADVRRSSPPSAVPTLSSAACSLTTTKYAADQYLETVDSTARLQRTQCCNLLNGSYCAAYWQVEWLKERIQKVSVRLVFESALELMGTTQLGSFKVPLSVSAADSHFRHIWHARIGCCLWAAAHTWSQ